jgi:ABC-type nitrate/sulfonate/bicarbonate transport system ATPase subunit
LCDLLRASSLRIEIKGLAKSFTTDHTTVTVLEDVSMDVEGPQVVGIIGPSGCGKSTLFNILSGLLEPDRGVILLGGESVPHLRGHVAYMQQKDLLLPWRTVLDNAVLGMEIQGIPKKDARMEALSLLQTFGLEGFENHYPHELSGGMRQRVALMRTILCRKEILLLDEPFGALDAITRTSMQGWLLKVFMEFEPSVLLVTHDMEEALILSDRIYVLSQRPTYVKATFEVGIPRPRKVTDPSLVELKEQLLRSLELDAHLG